MMMKFFAFVGLVVCATGSLMSMERGLDKSKFYLDQDKCVLAYTIRSMQCIPGPSIRPYFKDLVKLDDLSCNAFDLGCTKADANMIKVKALLKADKKTYLTKIEPILVNDERKRSFAVKMKLWEFQLDDSDNIVMGVCI
jgi:hypothetical protein